MTAVILVVHLLLAVAMIFIVLIQHSEGGGLGIGGGGGGGGGMGGFMTGRATANLLTRTTAFLAAGFMATSITLAILANQGRAPTSLIDQPESTMPANQPHLPAVPSLPQLPKAPAN